MAELPKDEPTVSSAFLLETGLFRKIGKKRRNEVSETELAKDKSSLHFF
jgi:hypothetical protein